MSNLSESNVIQKFRQHIEKKSLTDDIKITYRIGGGMPSERIEEEFILSGSGKAKVMMQDIKKLKPAKEASIKLNQAETRNLLQEIGQGLKSLVPRSKARFLPDSAVGSITVQVGREKAILYFLADEEERIAQDKPIAPEIFKAITHISKISKRVLKKRGGK